MRSNILTTGKPVRISNVAHGSSIVFPRRGVQIRRLLPPDSKLQSTCRHWSEPVFSPLSQEPRKKPDVLLKKSQEQLQKPSAEALKHGCFFTVAGRKGVSIVATDVSGCLRLVTEAVAGQGVAHYAQPIPVEDTPPVPPRVAGVKVDAITIGEALEVSALSAGEKPADLGDAAEIEAAEMRAKGRNVMELRGVAAAVQSAASANARTARCEEKTTLANLLTVLPY